MKYAYEDLSDGQFEDLVLYICQELLGIGVQGFAKGPDGGRDAKFEGVAELHPSKRSPWSGITIIQAKHTNSYNKSFSESDFFKNGSENNVIGKEIPRIQSLRQKGELDNYMLFANRRLAGNAESSIKKYISEQCDIPQSSIYLCGVEQLEVWLKTFPAVVEKADIDPVDSPLIVSPDELAEVVEALSLNKDSFSEVPDGPPTPRVLYEEKNKINGMSEEYARIQRKKYLKESAQIDFFLSNPENYHLMQMYESVVDEFQLKIIAKRKHYQTFDEVMEYLADLLFGRDPVLRQHKHKRITRAVLFYMYWKCDIGSDEDVATN